MKTNLFLKIHTYIHWWYICNTHIHKHTHTRRNIQWVYWKYIYRESKQIGIHILIFNINRFSFLNALNGHLAPFSSSSPHISHPPSGHVSIFHLLAYILLQVYMYRCGWVKRWTTRTATIWFSSLCCCEGKLFLWKIYSLYLLKNLGQRKIYVYIFEFVVL